MKDDDVIERIFHNPKFLRFVRIRNTYSIVLCALMLIVYFGYILLIAFNKSLLAAKVGAGTVTSIGIPLGIGVLLFTIAVTVLYVRRANGEFDAIKDEIVKEATG